MSESSIKGKTLELKIASVLRSKLGVRVERDKRSGAGLNKADISDWYRELPIFIEAKNQKTIKIKEFFKQAEQGASVGQVPTVVFNVDDEEVLACLRFSDLVNFIAEIKDYKDEVEMLRAPVEASNIGDSVDPNLVSVIQSKVKECRNGHISDENGYCQQKNCKYSRSYRPAKVKK